MLFFFILLFKDFGNSSLEVLLQKFQPALEAAGKDPSEIMPQCIHFKHQVKSEMKNTTIKKKRAEDMKYNRSRLRREEECGPAEIPGDHDAHVCVEAQQEVQAAVPDPSDDAKDDDGGGLSDYYSDDELVTDNKLIDQENEAYEMLTSTF